MGLAPWICMQSTLSAHNALSLLAIKEDHIIPKNKSVNDQEESEILYWSLGHLHVNHRSANDSCPSNFPWTHWTPLIIAVQIDIDEIMNDILVSDGKKLNSPKILRRHKLTDPKINHRMPPRAPARDAFKVSIPPRLTRGFRRTELPIRPMSVEYNRKTITIEANKIGLQSVPRRWYQGTPGEVGISRYIK